MISQEQLAKPWQVTQELMSKYNPFGSRETFEEHKQHQMQAQQNVFAPPAATPGHQQQW